MRSPSLHKHHLSRFGHCITYSPIRTVYSPKASQNYDPLDKGVVKETLVAESLSSPTHPSLFTPTHSSLYPTFPSSPPPLPFDASFEKIFSSHSAFDLLRAAIIFKACSFSSIASWTPRILSAARKLYLDGPLFWAIKSTIYRQFCGGETLIQIQYLMQELARRNIHVIIDYASELDVAPDGMTIALPSTHFSEGERALDDFLQHLKRSVDLIVGSRATQAFVAVKLSGLFDQSLLESLTKSLQATQDCEISNAALSNLIKDPIQRESFERGWKRLCEICQYSQSKAVTLVMDAEQSFLQDAIDAIILSVMRKFNAITENRRPWVLGTYQMYRKDGLERLRRHLAFSQDAKFHFGTKIVRGAYVLGERIWAKEREKNNNASKIINSNSENDVVSSCPIFDTIEETHQQYDKAITFMMDYITESRQGDQRSFELIFATHNLQSIIKATQLVRDRHSLLGSNRVSFAQLYGMSDHISTKLAECRYRVFKYVPFGSVHTVIPYLIRRAQENSSAYQLASSDANLIYSELVSRLPFNKKGAK